MFIEITYKAWNIHQQHLVLLDIHACVSKSLDFSEALHIAHLTWTQAVTPGSPPNLQIPLFLWAVVSSL